MMHRRRALVAAALLLTLAAVCIGCGPKEPPPPGGAFTDPSRPATATRARPSDWQAGGVPSAAGAVVLPPGAGPAAGPDRAAVETEVDDYLQRAREYEQEQERLRQEELDSTPPSDMWVPIPEAPEAEEPVEDEAAAYPSG